MQMLTAFVLLCYHVFAIVGLPTTPSQHADGIVLPLQSSNTSQVLTGALPSMNRPLILPYRIKVPNTRTTIRLGFGIPRKDLDPNELSVLLAVTEAYVDEQLQSLGAGGAQAPYPVMGLGEQYFHKSLGDDVHIEIWNLEYQDYFTWTVLRNVLRGLSTYLIDGKRYRQCWFEFSNGQPVPVGAGRITAGLERAFESD
ncbi:hypothetical protein ACLMJK_003000 [Lecanora helva]